MKIQLLDQQLINKIAAGEVVERPASVVKELIENSLDAGASEIIVEIEEGGMNLIRVTDDGCGMTAEDAKMCVRRHATSKLRTIQDLHVLSTLGFRGEALAAISAVGKFRLVTRPESEVGAHELAVTDGKIDLKQSAGPKGTLIEIQGLFHNVPARKKFLKSAQTEFRHILDVFINQALLWPQVAFRLDHNSKTNLQYPRVNDWAQRVSAVLGGGVAEKMIEINHQRASLKVGGFIAHPSTAQQSRKQQYIFVNQRPVGDYLIAKAVKEGYGRHIAHDRHPSFVLQISIAPDLVDVNVHPRKSEVKFADTRSVFREVVFAVNQALGSLEAAPAQAAWQPKPSQSYTLKSSSGPAPTAPSFSFSRPSASPVRSMPTLQTVSEPVQDDHLGDWKLMGQIHDSYILVESGEGLIVIDQHAAAEKIRFEEMMLHLKEPKVQVLLVPVLVELSTDQMALVQEHQETLNQVGIEGEAFGGNSFRLTGLPQDLDVSDVKQFFAELIDDMSDEAFGKIQSLEDRQKRLMEYAACRGAIKFGDRLTTEEQIQLLKDIRKYNVLACVHGRPVMFELSKGEMNKKFQRP